MKGPRLSPALRDQPQRVLGPEDGSGASAWRPLNHTRTTLRAGSRNGSAAFHTPGNNSPILSLSSRCGWSRRAEHSRGPSCTCSVSVHGQRELRQAKQGTNLKIKTTLHGAVGRNALRTFARACRLDAPAQTAEIAIKPIKHIRS